MAKKFVPPQPSIKDALALYKELHGVSMKHPSSPRYPKDGLPEVRKVENFLDALAMLPEPHQQFVRHRLAGKTYAESYTLSGHVVSKDTAKKKGSLLAQTMAVEQAIRLGSQELAYVALKDLKFDLAASFKEFGAVLEAAMKDKQYTAAVGAASNRAKLFKLLDADTATQAQQVNFNFGRFGEDVKSVTVEGEKSTNSSQTAPEEEKSHEPINQL